MAAVSWKRGNENSLGVCSTPQSGQPSGHANRRKTDVDIGTFRPSRRTFIKSSLLAASGAVVGQVLPGVDAKQVPPSSAPLRFGVNYIPRKNWWYCWQDWDAKAIMEDFEVIRSLGMDHIRIQCLWPLIQPGMSYVSERLLENMNSLLEAAERTGLDVEIAVLNGWLSGFAFMPAWTAPVATGKGNIFSDPEIIGAEQLLFKKLADTVGVRPRFLGFDLGNELSVLLPLGNPATQQQADAWTSEMFRHLNNIAPGKFHVNGLDHTVWWSDIAFSRHSAATEGHATIVHSYAKWSGSLERYGYSGVGTLHLVEYNVELAYAYQTDLARRVWLEEVGASPEWMPESYLREFCTQVLRNAAETGVLWGITWWGSHDIDPAIKGFYSMEYTLGLIDQKNHVKPIGRIIASLARELRGQTFSSIDRQTALVVPDTGLSTRPHINDWTYGTAFMDLVAHGMKPCIVLESRAKDENYLRSRGISHLIPLADVSKA